MDTKHQCFERTVKSRQRLGGKCRHRVKLIPKSRFAAAKQKHPIADQIYCNRSLLDDEHRRFQLTRKDFRAPPKIDEWPVFLIEENEEVIDFPTSIFLHVVAITFRRLPGIKNSCSIFGSILPSESNSVNVTLYMTALLKFYLRIVRVSPSCEALGSVDSGPKHAQAYGKSVKLEMFPPHFGG
jgi:hypothetical protein